MKTRALKQGGFSFPREEEEPDYKGPFHSHLIVIHAYQTVGEADDGQHEILATLWPSLLLVVMAVTVKAYPVLTEPMQYST